jgi:hypothetical protein
MLSEAQRALLVEQTRLRAAHSAGVRYANQEIEEVKQAQQHAERANRTERTLLQANPPSPNMQFVIVGSVPVVLEPSAPEERPQGSGYTIPEYKSDYDTSGGYQCAEYRSVYD